jgi:hypothetical protein
MGRPPSRSAPVPHLSFLRRGQRRFDARQHLHAGKGNNPSFHYPRGLTQTAYQAANDAGSPPVNYRQSRADCSASLSLRHVDDHRIAAQAQHQTFPFAFEVHDDPGLVLKPKVAAAHCTDHKPVLTLGI